MYNGQQQIDQIDCLQLRSSCYHSLRPNNNHHYSPFR